MEQHNIKGQLLVISVFVGIFTAVFVTTTVENARHYISRRLN